MAMQFLADDTILVVAINGILGSSLHLIPIVLHSSLFDALHLRFRIHHALDSLGIIVRVRRFRHFLNSVHTRIVVFVSLIVWVDFIIDELIHLSVVFLQVDIAGIQFVIQTFLLVTPAVFQDVSILLLLVHFHLF